MLNFYKLNQILENQEEEEEEKLLIPRRSMEIRQQNQAKAIQRQIQQYIKNGSKGDLDLNNTPITNLPNNLTSVGGYLDLFATPITTFTGMKFIN